MFLCVHLCFNTRCLIAQVVRCRALVDSVGRGDYVGLLTQRPKPTASFSTRRGLQDARAPYLVSGAVAAVCGYAEQKLRGEGYAILAAKGLLLKEGSMVDAPSSTLRPPRRIVVVVVIQKCVQPRKAISGTLA